MPDASSAAVNSKGSIFRSILGGALLGLGGGMGGDDFGSALSGGFKTVEAERDKQRTQGIQDRAEARADSELDLKKQQVAQGADQVAIQRGQAESQNNLNNANAAMALTNKLKTEKEMADLPDQIHERVAAAYATMASEYEKAGVPIQAELDDTPEARSAYLNQLQQQGKSTTDYSFVPSPDKGKVLVVPRGSGKFLEKDMNLTMADGEKIKITKGTPFDIVDNIISDATQKSVAKLYANAKTPEGVGKLSKAQLDAAKADLVSMDKEIASSILQINNLQTQIAFAPAGTKQGTEYRNMIKEANMRLAYLRNEKDKVTKKINGSDAAPEQTVGRKPAINPQGQLVTLPADQYDQALLHGYKPATQ